jgi:hypothetical protein
MHALAALRSLLLVPAWLVAGRVRLGGASGLLAAGCLLLASGCAAAPSSWRTVKPLSDRPITARAVAVYPFAFRWDEPASRSLLLAMKAVDALSATDRLLVFGPTEFTVLSHEANDPRASTDLLAEMAQRSLPATSFVALRCWAEQRAERTVGTIDGKGKVLHTERVTYVEHLELLDGAGGGVLLELEGQVERDPAAASDPFDPTPDLTRLHQRLLERAWAALEPRLTAPSLAPLAVGVRWLPAAAVTWAPPGAVSLADLLARADPLDADVRRLAVYGFVDPGADDGRLAQAVRLPGGLLVERAEGPWAEGLRPGDVIVKASGEPAAGRQVLQRVAALSRAGVVELTVVRGKATVPVTVILR